jgi:crossover junction endodeoxyribonuclease RusA
MFKLQLPFPPSVNHYWRHVGKRVLISKQGREFRAEVGSLIRRKRIEAFEGDLIVDIKLTPPDRRRRDIDNSLKALLDAMQFGGVYIDDSQIVRLTIEKLQPDRDNSSATVVVQHLPRPTNKEGIRSCLRCSRAFKSIGPGNRICRRCTIINSQLPEKTPIDRGRKFHNGELME